MKMQIDWVQFVMQSILFFGGLFKVYADVQVKLKEIDVRLSAVEKQDDLMLVELKKIVEKLHEIQIELTGKQDR
jgi:heme/copper-type cytochrome/quinol oxidase subunit 3